jgi:signal transduction histidine kinase
MVEPREWILVIDDELGMRRGCRRALTRRGYRVEVAETGQEGLTKIRDGQFALVLLDVMMPDASGIELLADIRENDPDTVCIIITGYATVELAVEAMKLGAHDFIAKPFSDDNLILAVENGLERRRLKKEARRLQHVGEEAQRLSQEKAMLEELDRVKSAFMRNVAHELRAPIAAIRSFMSLMLEGYATPEKQRLLQERTAERADELLALVDDLLELTKLKDASRAAKRQRSCIKEALQDVVSLHEPEAEAKGLEFIVGAGPCPQIEADPTHLKQLWTNLISNAIKYTPKGGRITVRLSHQNRMIYGEVRDTGIGISQEDLPRLFEEFFRTDRAKALTQHGTGLGLSIVKRIVEEYGGEVQAKSALDKGTCFTFRLPVADLEQHC